MSAPTGTGREPGELTLSEEHDLAPGLPPHKHRRTDVDPKAAQRAERQVAAQFLLSALATVGFVVAYVTIPRDETMWLPVLGDVNAMNFTLGLTMGLSLLLIGTGAIHWAKKLMTD